MASRMNVNGSRGRRRTLSGPIALCTLSFGLCGLYAKGQVSTFKTDVTVVNVLCTVRDRAGNLITDLTRDDFEIFDNGNRQSVRYFALHADLSLYLGLLVDVSGSVQGIVEQERKTAGDFLTHLLRPGDSGMIAGFADSVNLWQAFTPSLDLLKAGLAKVKRISGPPPFETPKTMGGTVLYDAISVTATEEFLRKTGAKVLVVLSDGLDTTSSVTLESAVKSAQAAETVVYGICDQDRERSAMDHYFAIHSRDIIRYYSGCDALKAISRPTGGRMFVIAKDRNTEPIFAAIRQEINGQYLLGFSLSIPPREGTFHKLEIKTKRNGLVVRGREGYYTFKSNER
jgi:Ca-activated chloride channel family protein